MRVKTLLAALVAMVIAGNVANAGWIVTSTRVAGTGVNAGHDVVSFFAKYDGTDPTNTKLQSVDMGATITDSDPAHIFKFNLNHMDVGADEIVDPEQDGDGVLDVDFLGATPVAVMPTRTYVRIGTASSFLAGDPYGKVKPWSDTNGNLVYDPGPGATQDREIQPQADPAWMDTKTFRVAGFNTTPVPATTGLGAKFVQLVVPTGTPVAISARLAGEKEGATGPYNVTDPVPEPGTISLLGIAAFGLLARRRRD